MRATVIVTIVFLCLIPKKVMWRGRSTEIYAQFLYFCFFVNYLLSCLHSCPSVQADVQLMVSFIGFYCAVKPGLKHSNLIDIYNYELHMNSQTH